MLSWEQQVLHWEEDKLCVDTSVLIPCQFLSFRVYACHVSECIGSQIRRESRYWGGSWMLMIPENPLNEPMEILVVFYPMIWVKCIRCRRTEMFILVIGKCSWRKLKKEKTRMSNEILYIKVCQRCRTKVVHTEISYSLFHQPWSFCIQSCFVLNVGERSKFQLNFLSLLLSWLISISSSNVCKKPDDKHSLSCSFTSSKPTSTNESKLIMYAESF